MMANVEDEHYFEFTLGRNTEPIQYRVRVYQPAKGDPIPGRRPQTQSNTTTIFRTLRDKLNPEHISRNPDPTITLVREGPYRIDSQPATVKYRNIHYQEKDRSYAVITVDYGGSLCYVGRMGYELKLLRYITTGLTLSHSIHYMHNIRVTVVRRVREERKWIDITKEVDYKYIQKIGKMFEKIRKKAAASSLIYLEYAKNIGKIAERNYRIGHVAAAIERHFAKIVEKEGPLAAAKKIPFVAAVLGVVLAAQRVWNGDYVGAIAELVSGVAAGIPGLGIALAMVIDAVLLAKDVGEALEDTSEHKRLQEWEVDDLKKKNDQMRKEAAEILPESPMYGAGCTKPFDEFGLATLEDITEIRVRCGDVIDGIQMVYRSQRGQHHGGNGGDLRVLQLRPDEKITTVRGTTRDGGKIISSLTFCTDYGREETFGVKNPDEFEFEMTDGSYLGAIRGFDAYDGGCKTCPWWSEGFQLLPAIAFIPKF